VFSKHHNALPHRQPAATAHVVCAQFLRLRLRLRRHICARRSRTSPARSVFAYVYVNVVTSAHDARASCLRAVSSPSPESTTSHLRTTIALAACAQCLCLRLGLRYYVCAQLLRTLYARSVFSFACVFVTTSAQEVRTRSLLIAAAQVRCAQCQSMVSAHCVRGIL
jgi:hypothetical protein